MKKKLLILTIIVLSLCLTGCSNEYEGYWCKYDESSTIVVLLNKNYKETEKNKVQTKIDTFENVKSVSFYSKEDYAQEIGGDPNEMDIYDTFVVTLDTMDSIGTYIEELEKIPGVASAEQSYAKSNLSLYNIKSWGKYTFTDSDEATTADLETGKYKMKKGVITFTPDDKEKETKILYTKDGFLCGDAGCSKIYARSNSTCSTEE